MDCQPSRVEVALHSMGAIAAACLSQEAVDLTAPICEALEAEVGCLLLAGREPAMLFSSAVWHRGNVLHAELSSSSRLEPVGSVVRDCRRQVINRPTGHAHLFQDLRRITGEPVGPTLIAPLPQRGQAGGVLLVAREAKGPGFTEAEADLFDHVAAVVALALGNRALRDEVGILRGSVARLDAQVLQSAKLAATGKLAASIAHEINNPLQSVQSCIYLVSDSVTNEGPGRQYLGIAREELDRIGKIVQRLTDFYRPSQEGSKPIDLNHVLENVLALMGKRIQHGRVTVATSLAPDLPATMASADQIKQVFVNLILNALEAMPDGGQLAIRTAVAEHPHGRFIQASFKDSGEGIAADTHARIFDPFFTTKAKGTGLGLSISHDIIQRHGGTIEVESEPGSGSTFTVCLPIGVDAPARGHARVREGSE